MELDQLKTERPLMLAIKAFGDLKAVSVGLRVCAVILVMAYGSYIHAQDRGFVLYSLVFCGLLVSSILVTRILVSGRGPAAGR